MKAIKLVMSLSLLLAVSFVFNSCEKSQADVTAEEQSVGVKSAVVQYCGTPMTVDFLAGQHIPAGSVIVGNDETNLYVTFVTVDGWVMKATHLYVGDGSDLTNKGGSVAPGQFPYKATHKPSVTSFTYTIPLEKVPACSVIAAHAEVEKWVDGKMVDSQTAWGKGETIGKSWAMKFEYCQQECIPQEEDVCYGGSETAWATGSRYVSQGNWATYTEYAEGTVNIYAGQSMLAGTATFSAVVDGKVTITINLDGWALQDVSESVKIQGYDAAPSGNPAPGQFTTYKGTALTVTVPAYAFYGIHLDVREIVECTK